MKSINFNSGKREYAVNGDENNVISVNISDLNLGKRIEDMSAKSDELQEKYKEIASPTASQLYEIDSEIRSVIDGAFGAEICSHAFGNVNCLSSTEDGKMLFESFMEAFMPLVESDIKSFKKAESKVSENVGKYLDKKPEIPEFTDEQRQKLLELLK